MIKYGLTYYTAGTSGREPQSGLQVRLVRPGGTWATGIELVEKAQTGFYECEIDDEADYGYYEVFDNRTDPNGSASGRTVTIGKLDGNGLQDRSVGARHIADGAVTAQKIAPGAIDSVRLEDGGISLTKVKYHVSTELNGIGSDTSQTPATESDAYAIHSIPSTYSSIPIILLTPKCDRLLWIESVMLTGDQLTVKVGIGKTGSATQLKYDIVIFG